MKATFALIPDLDTQNAATSIAWDLHRSHGVGLDIRKLPPHISLKQPFDAPELKLLVELMDDFKGLIDLLEIEFSGPVAWSIPSGADSHSGVLALLVEKHPQLRFLHRKLNEALSSQFGERSAEFDGDAYEFHLTLARGEAPLEVYEAIAAGLHHYPKSARLDTIALFVYDRPTLSDDWTYTTYRILPLGKPER